MSIIYLIIFGGSVVLWIILQFGFIIEDEYYIDLANFFILFIDIVIMMFLLYRSLNLSINNFF